MKIDKPTIKAQLNWLPEGKGRRNIPPMGSIFGANLRFENDEALWSVVIYPESVLDDDRIQIVELGFLFPENITTELDIGREFLVYEGPQKLVALGRVISKG